jgi:hypothetical protein
MMDRRSLCRLPLALLPLALPWAAAAQLAVAAVKVIVGYSPGGAVDIISARCRSSCSRNGPAADRRKQAGCGHQPRDARADRRTGGYTDAGGQQQQPTTLYQPPPFDLRAT